MSNICFVAGDTEFQKTLSEAEWAFIREGDNWISKFGRETKLKALHHYGEITFENLQALPEEEQKELWGKILDKWNKHCEENPNNEPGIVVTSKSKLKK